MTNDFGITVDLHSLEEVTAALTKLESKMSTKLLSKAIAQGAKPIQKAMKEKAYTAPKKYPATKGMFAGYYAPAGQLKKSIGTKLLTKYPPVAYIGPERGAGKKYEAYFAHWVERGRYKAGYKETVFPQPFMRPAWDSQKDVAIEAIRKYLHDELVKMGKWQ